MISITPLSSGSPYTLPPADMQCGELPLFKDSDEPSGVAGARARPHAGAAVHQRSFKELGFARLDPSDTGDPCAPRETPKKDKPSAGRCVNHPLDERGVLDVSQGSSDCKAACALATPVGTSIRHARAPGSEVVIQEHDFFDDFQCQPDDLAAARQTWQLSRDTSGSRALIGRCEVHPWSAGGVFGKTRPSNAGGDLRTPDIVSQYIMYLQFFLPDGELALVQDKLSVMAGAHAGAAAQQQ